MAKYIFLNLPLHSHVNPTLPVVQTLVKRGEEVTYYLTEPFRAAIEATGAKFHPYESKLEDFARTARGSGKPVGLPMHMPEEALFVIPQIMASIQEEQPVCIVYDTLCLSGRLIAEILHIPAVVNHIIFAFNDQLSLHFQSRAAQDFAGMQAFQTAMKELCQQYPIRPFVIENIFTHQEPLNLVTIPRAFQIAGESFGKQYCFIGPALASRNEQTDFPFEQLADQPVIYITQGTVFNNQLDFYNLCFSAFADTSWRVVMSIGKVVDQSKFASIPPNVIVCPYVPQLEILKHTHICINHGGMTTIMESLALGVPLVVIPQNISDQGVNAKQVDALGLGLMLDHASLTVETLREAVTRISNEPAFYQRARAMQEEIHASGGYKRAADILIEYVRSRV